MSLSFPWKRQLGTAAVRRAGLFFLACSLAACGTGRNASPQSVPAADNRATPETAAIELITPEAQPTAAATATATVKATPAAGSGFDCASQRELPSGECWALVALYDSTNGAGWVDNGGWLASGEPCSWSGITCSDGHVEQIYLLYNGLAGPLPPELGDLSRLRVLGLWANELQGSIPPEMGGLSELEFLDLSVNQLSGPLPEALGELAKLKTLNLAHNQLEGSIPAQWGDLADLDSLDLSHNQLRGPIPAEFGNLGNLTRLLLSNNQLSEDIPNTLGGLRQLYELDLSYNQLSGSVPQAVNEIAQRALWGNQFAETIGLGGQAPIDVVYQGIHAASLTVADPSLGDSLWPEIVPAVPVPEGGPIWYAAPEHLRLTFANPDLSPGRQRMGINLAAEAQILVYPLADLAQIDPLIQERIETLQRLLESREPLPAGELPLLPLTNAAQVFHAQGGYLDSGYLQGIRYVSQHSQEALPIISQEIFYTFQGISRDGLYYVAAFFPLTTAVLPDKIEVEDWEAFSANYAAYVAETIAVLDQLSPAEFMPDLNLLDAVISSLSVDPGSTLLGTKQVSGPSPSIAPPTGLVYKTSDGLWRIGEYGEPYLLSARAEALPAPDAAHAVYLNEDRQLQLIDLASGSERSLAAGVDLSGQIRWGDAQTLLVGIWLEPAESEGVSTGHVATLDIDTGELKVIDKEHLSLGRPDLAPDGQTVAYDISPFYIDVTQSGFIYHAASLTDSGAQPVSTYFPDDLEEGQQRYLFNPAWSPDGRQLVWLSSTEAGMSLVQVDLALQKTTTLLSWQPAQFGALPPSPVWNPDGDWLAVDVWAGNEAESGLWLAAADRSYVRRISVANSSSMVGQGPVWLNSHELAYIECDHNHSNCKNWLFDPAAEKKVLLGLPPGGIVLLAPSSGTAEE